MSEAKLTLEVCERCGAMDVYLHGDDTLRCHCCGRTENPITTIRREERGRGRGNRAA